MIELPSKPVLDESYTGQDEIVSIADDLYSNSLNIKRQKFRVGLEDLSYEDFIKKASGPFPDRNVTKSMLDYVMHSLPMLFNDIDMKIKHAMERIRVNSECYESALDAWEEYSEKASTIIKNLHAENESLKLQSKEVSIAKEEHEKLVESWKALEVRLKKLEEKREEQPKVKKQKEEDDL